MPYPGYYHSHGFPSHSQCGHYGASPHYTWAHHWCYPHEQPGESGCRAVLLPREQYLDTNTPETEVFVGGIAPVKLCVEYMAVSGAASPSISITLESSSTHTWDEPSPGAGYATKTDLPMCEPGTRITAKVSEMIARVRWFEAVEY